MNLILFLNYKNYEANIILTATPGTMTPKKIPYTFTIQTVLGTYIAVEAKG